LDFFAIAILAEKRGTRMSHKAPENRKWDARELMLESLEVLRNYRHDLMNQVQLLQAYSQMKKYDRLEAPIQTLVEEAARHTEWSSFPSPMLSYVVLSHDIRYSMLKVHATYEQMEAPSEVAELLAARVLSDILDCLGAYSLHVLEPLPVDVWIVSFSQGYEIGWFVCGQDGEEEPGPDWETLRGGLQSEGVEWRREQTEEGVEHTVRFQLDLETA
jgi:stage 0 sporulation protein B (sporulation initiation phosphotransferase)